MTNHKISDKSFQKELVFAKSIARDSGKMMRAAFGIHTSTTWKDDHTPVTEADLSINKFVIKKVRETFQDDGVLGEEISFEPNRKRIWVCDPIDGTYPFSLGAPLSTFCLALVENDEPIIGVVYDPYLKRLFWAQRGNGAFMNSEQIHVSKARKLKDQYMTLSSRILEPGLPTGVVFDKVENHGGKVFNFRSFAYCGSLVAAGTSVAATIGTPKPWDVAAIQIILEEAGGKLTDLSGNVRKYDDKIGRIASNGLVHDEILELIHG
ncbi:MAG TPA: inositol monophosphatase [Candidatus Saccharimonadales bacterium]|nr:inositol monophosphatase [Candidatus Saccharimonadales bacterium]